MAILVPCPNCGEREFSEFSYGGESNKRPAPGAPPADLARYLFFRRNLSGVQVEWWYHRDGCQRWLLARRNTSSNLIEEAYWPEEREARKR